MEVSFHSPPSFLSPNLLTESGVFENKSKDSEFFPLQNEALESCLKMKSILTREVYVVCIILKNMKYQRQCFLDHLHQTPSGKLVKKMKISMSQETYIRIFMAVFVIIPKQNKNWK